MHYIDYEILTGQKNMAKDAELLDMAIKTKMKEPIFRLYGWSPACVSLGRNQNDDFLDYEKLKSLNIDVVRRLTGGRALLHDDEITYSVVCPTNYLPNGENVVGSYKDICQILIDKFAEISINLTLGETPVHTKSSSPPLSALLNNKPDVVTLSNTPLKRFAHVPYRKPFSDTKANYCMLVSTGADLCYQGKKLIGSAQFRKEGYILQHGSILYDYDKVLLETIFNQPVNTNQITTIKEINPSLTKSNLLELLSNIKL